ncbi:MAG: extracellular solute-binding protein [Planctomycetes bacterium]|nr:extracellular solute-binding protein [Planctomycetota bacterium]
MLIAALFAPLGCDDHRTAGQPDKPFDGRALTLSCPDAAMADAVTPMVRAWEARTGATVTVHRGPMNPSDAADVGIIPSGELGAWAEPGHLSAVPAKLRSDAAFQWTGLLPAYGERLVEWGGQTLAVPLTGDGYVLVYRADRFAEKSAADAFFARHTRPLAAPSTWEEFADVAALFAGLDKRPSLPPLPSDPERLFDLLSRVAASFDRSALNDFQLAAQTAKDREALAFQFAVTTGKPRLQSSGYVNAADWLARLRATNVLPAPGGADDPAAALSEGRAVMALVSLDQLARLPREGGAVPARFALAGVPGTRQVRGAGPSPADGPPNFVPYFSGGRLGVVRTRCPHQEAAFDLLADLGSPARGAELIATPGLGAGPTRVAHVDRERLLLWLGYGFDEERSKMLQDTMRHYAEQAVKNPTFGLRGPDRAELIRAADPPLRALGTDKTPAVDRLKQIEAAWQVLDAKVSPETLLRWRQRAAGLN